jgi:hypothetical protein
MVINTQPRMATLTRTTAVGGSRQVQTLRVRTGGMTRQAVGVLLRSVGPLVEVAAGGRARRALVVGAAVVEGEVGVDAAAAGASVVEALVAAGVEGSVDEGR